MEQVEFSFHVFDMYTHVYVYFLEIYMPEYIIDEVMTVMTLWRCNIEPLYFSIYAMHDIAQPITLLMHGYE